MRRTTMAVAAVCFSLGAGCSTPAINDDGVGGAGGGAGGGTGGSGTGGAAECGPDTSDPDEVVSMGGADPLGGVFTLEQALEGLPPGDGPLRAVITTELGDITCTFDERPQNAVANFVGLARGVRPWQDPATSNWVKRRFYDGLLYHRIIDDFMAQGGDPLGTGFGGPGYQIADEIFPDLVFEPGTLAYANSGPNTNGSQYFITEVTTDWLDGDFTILGKCEPMEVIEALTAVETDANDRPTTDTLMQRIEVTRCSE
jgi:peptidyl-prolyl cis-trans isomerase A (cyclophilin A)